jgi:hypothetical protein
MDFMLLRPVKGTLNATAPDPPPTWNAIVEMAIKDMRDKCEVLHALKKMYNPLGERHSIWECGTETERFMPSLGSIKDTIKDLEKKTTPVDWKDLVSVHTLHH